MLDSGSFDNALSEDLITLMSRGDIENALRIIDTGRCNLNYTNENGMTPLSVCASRNDLEAMCILTERGANVNSGVGLDYLVSLAKVNENQEMISFLEKKGKEESDKKSNK